MFGSVFDMMFGSVFDMMSGLLGMPSPLLQQQAIQDPMQQQQLIQAQGAIAGPQITNQGSGCTITPSAFMGLGRPTAEDIFHHWLTDDERSRLSPAAQLAIGSGSQDDLYLNELRLVLGSRCL